MNDNGLGDRNRMWTARMTPKNWADTLQAAISRVWPDHSNLGDMCRYAMLPPGKLLRPTLLLASAAAVGGDPDAVLPAALGAEFGHTASLVHDDIMDGDLQRRGRRSLHTEYDTDSAMLAGNALFFSMFKSLTDCYRNGISADQVVEALEVIAGTGVDMCEGQILEAGLVGDLQCSVQSYLKVVDLKTGALIRGSCGCGAILGGGSRQQVSALMEFGTNLGRAFQIVDDLLPYISDNSTTGKPTLSDLHNRRITLPIIETYRLGNAEDRKVIEDIFKSPERHNQDFDGIAEIAARTGALRNAIKKAGRYATNAKKQLEPFPNSESRRILDCYADMAISRRR